MADWEDASAHESNESADEAAGAPLADDVLAAENPVQTPDAPSPEQAESFAAAAVDEPPFLNRPTEPPAGPDLLPDDLQALKESLEQPTGEMKRLDVDAAAAQVSASFEGTEWPHAASDPQPEADPAEQPAAEQPVTGPAEQPAAEQSLADPAASEATTSWEALVAAAATAATASAATAAEESSVAVDTPVSAASEETPETAIEPAAEGETAEGETAEGETAEGEPSAEHPAEGEQPAEGEASLDNIAPGTVATEQGEAGEQAEEAEEGEATEELVAGPVTKVSWWPFVGYIVVWLGAAGYSVYQLRDTPIGQGVYETPLYRMTVVGGLGLLAAGPALLLIVWLASWIGRKNRRIGSMFISALVKGATATLLGAIIWTGAIILIDYLRLGRPF